MQQTDLPLYLKTSPIHNKIAQLTLAILLIIVVFNYWSDSYVKTLDEVDVQFHKTGESFLQQAVVTAKVLLKNKNKTSLNQFIQALPEANIVQDARLYDLTGQIIAESVNSQSISRLYGLDSDIDSTTDQYVPFVMEIRDEKLLGYMRISLKKNLIAKPLEQRIGQQAEAINLMLLFAGAVGFLITRGFSRFSRQSFRINRAMKD